MELVDFTLPQEGQLTCVAEGVYWLRMPLPFDLDHINLYLLEDKDGWYVVDTGLDTDITREYWQQILNQLSKPVKAVILTHMHPDHSGLAGWFCSQFRVPLYMTMGEYYVGRALINPNKDADRWTDEAYFVQAGLANEEVASLTSNNKGFASVVSPFPLAFRRISQGFIFEINGNHWEVITGGGHSPEHACLYCHELHTLIVGDQVLPYISPNIGVYSQEPEANALKAYFDSFADLLALPAKTLVLPAHNQPFTGLHKRIRALQEHHHKHLNALLFHCQQPQSLVQCLPVMFKRKLNGRNIYFAVAECLSHLNYLYYEGRLLRSLDDNGVYRYQTDEEIEQSPESPDMDFLQV